MHNGSRASAILAAILLSLLVVPHASASGERLIVYGADTTDAERLDLAVRFGASDAVSWQFVTTPEMVANLLGTGLPASLADQSIAGAAVTCLNPGDGLRVRTANITRITAPVYAGALATAGVRDADVLIAAPSARPVTGESALVGALKAMAACNGGQPLDRTRATLAYEQVAQTVALAGPNSDLTGAAAFMLRAAQSVIGGSARDPRAQDAAIDDAAEATGVRVGPDNRAALTDFLVRLGALDWRDYQGGYLVQQVTPQEARLTAAPPAPPAPSQTAPAVTTPPASAAGTAQARATPAQAAPTTSALVPAPNVLSGELRGVGSTLTLQSNDGQHQPGVAQGVTVLRDGRRADLGDLRPGDHALVVLDSNGLVQRIEATSGTEGSHSTAAWLAPLLLSLALAAALWWLLTRREDPFILQRTVRRA